MSSSPAAFSPDHLAQQTPAEQLCYVHCNLCDTVLAVGVPCNSLFKTVTVRCGHCTNLLSVNLQGLLLPAAAANEQPNFDHALLSTTSPHGHLDEMPLQTSSLALDQVSAKLNSNTSSDNSGDTDAPAMSMPPVKATTKERDLRKSSTSVNRPPEKRQRVPSAYNRFIKEEIQRIKSSNPDITHREAFSAAAKNWAHFPHIHFGQMSDQGHKKTSIRPQEAMEDMLFKDGLYAASAAASIGVTPL